VGNKINLTTILCKINPIGIDNPVYVEK